MKLFVTVGSFQFKELCWKADELAQRHEVRLQYGCTPFVPVHCEGYRFKPSLSEDYEWADVVVCHEGAGTLFELTDAGLHPIVVLNPSTVDNSDVAVKLASEGKVTLCKDLNKLQELIERG